MKKSHGQMSESFLLGALLAFSGGFLDVYTYAVSYTHLVGMYSSKNFIYLFTLT